MVKKVHKQINKRINKIEKQEEERVGGCKHLWAAGVSCSLVVTPWNTQSRAGRNQRGALLR